MLSLVKGTKRRGYPQRILLRVSSDRLQALNTRDIIYVESDGSESRLFHVNGKPIRCGKQLGKLEPVLESLGFCRCHRRFIVNLDYVDQLVPRASKDWAVILKDRRNTKIPISRGMHGRFIKNFSIV